MQLSMHLVQEAPGKDIIKLIASANTILQDWIVKRVALTAPAPAVFATPRALKQQKPAATTQKQTALHLLGSATMAFPVVGRVRILLPPAAGHAPAQVVTPAAGFQTAPIHQKVAVKQTVTYLHQLHLHRPRPPQCPLAELKHVVEDKVAVVLAVHFVMTLLVIQMLVDLLLLGAHSLLLGAILLVLVREGMPVFLAPCTLVVMKTWLPTNQVAKL